MNNKILISAFFISLFTPALVFAVVGKVTILSPVSGAMISSKDKLSVKYEASPGTDGDHLHLNIDGKRIDIIHNMKGSVEITPLTAGKHNICLLVNTKAHVPTGAQSCIDVMVK